MPTMRTYEPFYSAGRDRLLSRVQAAYEQFKETRTFEFPAWLYGQPLGKLLRLEVEDCPQFGDTAYVEMDSARTFHESRFTESCPVERSVARKTDSIAGTYGPTDEQDAFRKLFGLLERSLHPV